MSRLLLIAVVTLLLGDASGVFALATPEACTSATDTQPDGKCASLCVRCACGAQPIVPSATTVLPYSSLCLPPAAVVPVDVAAGSPHDILHVPK